MLILFSFTPASLLHANVAGFRYTGLSYRKTGKLMKEGLAGHINPFVQKYGFYDLVPKSRSAGEV